MKKPDENSTVKEVRTYHRANFEKGVKCVCCGQFVKQYKRKITSSMAYGLILMRDCTEWTHIEDFFKSKNVPSSIRGDMSKLVYWNLLERKQGERTDGSNRIGLYRITHKGLQFIRGEIKVTSHVKLYNNNFQGFDGKNISIREALGNKFNYNELMKL